MEGKIVQLGKKGCSKRHTAIVGFSPPFSVLQLIFL
jgi:hypothetical protein